MYKRNDGDGYEVFMVTGRDPNGGRELFISVDYEIIHGCKILTDCTLTEIDDKKKMGIEYGGDKLPVDVHEYGYNGLANIILRIIKKYYRDDESHFTKVDLNQLIIDLTEMKENNRIDVLTKFQNFDGGYFNKRTLRNLINKGYGNVV